jgi:hypothetical protein
MDEAKKKDQATEIRVHQRLGDHPCICKYIRKDKDGIILERLGELAELSSTPSSRWKDGWVRSSSRVVLPGCRRPCIHPLKGDTVGHFIWLRCGDRDVVDIDTRAEAVNGFFYVDAKLSLYVTVTFVS